jgi:hypothetical protein
MAEPSSPRPSGYTRIGDAAADRAFAASTIRIGERVS